MATTTPNYGWAVPTSTDLVKDGATAIETLGDAIDASMNTALGTKKAGMVLLNTTSFSGVASQSMPAATFTSTYEAYKIVITNLTAAAGTPNLFAKLRISGTDSSANYYYGNLAINYAAGTGSYAAASNASVGFYLGAIAQTARALSFDLISPFETRSTYAVVNGINEAGGTTHFGTAYQSAATSYDSLSIVPASSTISGTISIYGVNK